LFEVTAEGLHQATLDSGGEMEQSVAEKRLSKLDTDSKLLEDRLEDDVEDRLEDLGYI
jgi:hypothetical protein